MPLRKICLAAACAIALLIWFSLRLLAAGRPATLASVEDAFVSEDVEGWSIGTASVSLHLGLDPSTGLLQVSNIAYPGSDEIWRAGGTPDSVVRIQNRLASAGEPAFRFRQASVNVENGGVRLVLDFEDSASRVRVARTFATYPGSAGVEMWSTFTADSSVPAVPLADIGIWQIQVPATTAQWVTGLSASAADGGAFARRVQSLASAGASLDIGSTARSSETAVPAVWFGGSPGSLLGGLLWSGAWQLSVGEPDAAGRVVARMSLGDTATVLKAGHPFETPHGVLGVAPPGELSRSTAWQSLIKNGLRHGRPFAAPVTYNTWFAYGNQVDEQTMRDQMDRAAAMGIELFVLDAGWYAGGSQVDDYSTGLGTWTADSRRFPSGLRALRDYAHRVGLKFGIWVEPERVDTSTINRSGLAKERFLATTGGRYDAGRRNESASAAQVCLGDEEARQWVLNELEGFLDEVGPDYLKWDNNYWINCDRTGHSHGDRDGNLAHVKGLYGILAALRERYPDLLVEDCASGGNRLDLGMLQYTDVAWMDDVSAPSTHVRHNLEGLSAVFPLGYLLSFVMDSPSESIHESPDLTTLIRSRDPGVLGFSLRLEELRAEALSLMTRAIAEYKYRRMLMLDSSSLLLTTQVPSGGRVDSDVIEAVSNQTGDSVLFVFAGIGSLLDRTVWPQALDAGAVYTRRWTRGTSSDSGEDIMANGIDLPLFRTSSSAVVVLARQPGPTVSPTP
ncbi:MAG: glycoside hydrolase family 36 protein [Vicinamibacterales bacterium]